MIKDIKVKSKDKITKNSTVLYLVIKNKVETRHIWYKTIMYYKR